MSWKYSGVLIFVALFIATNFVNKYVLSVLRFTYPTIFQGWQTFVGAIVLKILSLSKKVDLGVQDVTRRDLISWFPAMILFVVSIYSGSKALSQLPIPIFMALQTNIDVIGVMVETAMQKKVTSIKMYIILMFILLSSLMVSWTDPQFIEDGYVWMSVHILATGFKHLYSRVLKDQLKMSDLSRLYCNYVYSVIVLAPSSYFLGDALAAREFPFLYFYKFYIGCIFSGVFGVSLSICASRLKDSSILNVYGFHLSYSHTSAIAKLAASLMSLFFFDMIITAPNGFCIVLTLLAGFLLSVYKTELYDQEHGRTGVATDSKLKENGNIKNKTEDMDIV